MDDSEDLFAQLKTGTLANHDATEALAYPENLQQGTLSADQYRQLLLANWTIHRTLETAFAEALADNDSTSDVLADFFEHKSQWLEKDLQQVHAIRGNTKWGNVNTLANVAVTYSGIPELIGAMYVVEGSMLGGQVIRRWLLANPNLRDFQPFHFYGGHQQQTGQRWRTFRQLARPLVHRPADINRAVDAANATFKLFQTVYRQQL